jgi:hypothetical protein
MVAAIVARDNPALGIDESEVTVGLASIEHGSYMLQFQTQYEAEVSNAYGLITTSITEGDYSNAPIKSIEAVKTVRRVTRKYSTDIEFWERNGGRKQLATVTSSTKIDVEVPSIKGKTTLYGMVVGVGGVDPPRARIRLLNGVLFNCNITRRDQLMIARQLGERLYTEVGVYGTARWDARDMSLQYFAIERLTEYSKKPITDSLESLRAVVGEYYDRIDDIDEFIADVRGTDEEVYG